MTAPERVWILRNHCGEVTNVFDDDMVVGRCEFRDDVEYIRADLCIRRDDQVLLAVVEALEWIEGRRIDAISRADAIDASEDGAVLALCQRYGFGAVMDSAARQWARIPGRKTGAFFIGGCIGDTSVRDALAKIAVLKGANHE